MKDDKPPVKGPEPYSDKWYRAAYSVAMNFAAIGPCPKCNWPRVSGFTVSNCKCEE